MKPTNYRFQRWSGDGTLLPSIYREQSYMLPTGLRASLTPDADCVEMNMNARNGPLPGNGPGLGLSNMQVIRLSFAETESPQDSDWLPVWYGTLRVGGNPHDYDGETMTFRGMKQRLQEVTVPAGVYPEGDAGAVIRQIAQAVFGSGQLGFITSGPLGTPPGSLLIQYDASLIPDLGFTFKLADNQEVLFGKLLDQVVSDALSKLGLTLVWGVKPDGRFFFKVARTDTLAIPTSSLISFGLKAPAGETPCTSVLWTIGKDDQGKLIYYKSKDPSAAALRVGTYVREVVIGADLDPWATLSDFGFTVDSGSGPADASPDARARISEKTDTTGVFLSGNSSTARVQAVYTVNTFSRRLYLGVAINHFVAGGGTLTVARPGVPAVSYGVADGSTDNAPNAFTRFKLTLYNVPVGTVITASGGPDPSLPSGLAQAELGVRDIRGEVPDAVKLDGLAKFYYSRPSVAPADIESGTFVAPEDLRGQVSTPLPTGQGDYVQNVATYEYRLTGDGLVFGVLAGQADDPARLAAASLIKSLANKAAVTGAQTAT